MRLFRKQDGGGTQKSAEYRRLNHGGQVEQIEAERSTLNLQLCLGKRWLGRQIESSGKRFRKALSPPYSTLLRLTQAKSSQACAKNELWLE